MTARNIDAGAMSALQKGLNFAPTPRNIPFADIISGVEQAVRKMPSETAEEIRRETSRILSKSKPPKPNMTKAELNGLRDLRNDPLIVVLPADKGNATVIMEQADYDAKIREMLEEETYQKLAKDPTSKILRKTSELLKRSSLEESVIKNLLPQAPRPPTLYGLPKVHKMNTPLRPIVCTIGAPTYKLAKHLASLLTPHVGNCVHHIKNTSDFISRIKCLRLREEDIMVSFDVVSLFTNVPIKDSIELLSQLFDDTVVDLFKHTLTSSYFLYGGEYYNQTDGVAMGSPLAPVIANLFMEHFEDIALDTAPDKPSCFYRYVDDTFVVWPHGREKLCKFLDHINSIHDNIKFTMEMETDGALPFLDVLVSRKANGCLSHSVYRKPTHTDQYLHATSHHHPSQKQSVLRTLVYRAEVVSDAENLQKELSHLRKVFKDNGYSNHQITKAIFPKTRKQKTPEEDPQKLAFLPFCGSVTGKISRLLKRHKIVSVFRPPTKIRQLMRPVKDDVGLRTPGVYKIPCGCGQFYIGQTVRTIEQRCVEHERCFRLRYPEKSAIAEHALENGHRIAFEETSIITRTNSFWDSIIKEAIEIKISDNTVNKDGGLQLSTAWEPAIGKLKRARQARGLNITKYGHVASDNAVTSSSAATVYKDDSERDLTVTT